jgi:signal transduction histidine kinase
LATRFKHPFPDANVLIVDDEPANLTLLSGILTNAGYHNRKALDGYTALEFISEDEFDLILLDIMMPDIDGFEICEQLKSSPETNHIPIVIITALDDVEDYVRAIELGADDFLVKPVNPHILLARVKSYIKSKRQADDIIRLNQLKHDLTHMIVHDLKNPMTAVIAQLELLLFTGSLENSFEQAIRNCLNSTEEMHSLIDNILRIEKMESGGLRLNLSTVDLSRLAKQVIDSHSAKCESRRLKIISRIPDELKCRCDLELVRRVLQNLFTNALKFAPEGSAIEVAAGKNKNQIYLWIANRGPTIPRDQAEKVFDKFTQVEGGLMGPSEGVGLGLAFCKLAVDAHAGAIRLVSPPEGWPDGVRFEITFPVKVDNLESAEREREKQHEYSE